MFQKSTKPEDEVDPRYLTLGGFPVYTHEEPSFLKRAFRRARDYIDLPEVKYPLIAVAGALAIDSFFAENFEGLLSAHIIGGVLLGLNVKYFEFGTNVMTNISMLDIMRPRLRKPYYFDTAPEGPLNSEKPQADAFTSLKVRSGLNMLANGVMGACMLSAPVVTKEFSLSSLAITSLVAAPLLKATYRHAQVVFGNWDLTDQLPPKQKKPQEVAASSTLALNAG